MIGPIEPRHHADLLRMNADFVHWLSPLDTDKLDYILQRAAYQRQINEGAGILLGYAHDVNYPDHKNLTWLRGYLSAFFYIDRVIIDHTAQGQRLGHKLYEDVAKFAQAQGYKWLCCEVNTRPNNPASHAFHLKMGFEPIGEADYPDYNVAVRYYAKPL
ncbi:MAG: GNAT family N-acetyltransferase [Maricaulaceae bacterium]